jgi:hypothetical protein
MKKDEKRDEKQTKTLTEVTREQLQLVSGGARRRVGRHSN